MTAIVGSSKKVDKAIADWRKFYRQGLGLTTKFKGLSIPNKKIGFERILIVNGGLGYNELFAFIRKTLGADCYLPWSDLSRTFGVNARWLYSPDEAYAVRVRDVPEAADSLPAGHTHISSAHITLLEYMLFTLKYFEEAGRPLDLKRVTSCNGTIQSSGDTPGIFTPNAGIDLGSFRITWCNLRCQRKIMGRSVVS